MAERFCGRHSRPVVEVNISEGPTFICEVCEVANRENKKILRYQEFTEKCILRHSGATSDGRKSFERLFELIRKSFGEAKEKISLLYEEEERQLIEMVKSRYFYRHLRKPTRPLMQGILDQSTLADAENEGQEVKRIISELLESREMEAVDENQHLIEVLADFEKWAPADKLLTCQFQLGLSGARFEAQRVDEQARMRAKSREYALKYKARADQHYDRKEYEKAIEVYSSAIDMDPGLYSAFNRRGNCYHMLEEYIKAREDFDRAIAIKEDFSIAYYNKGNALRKLKLYKESIEEFRNAIKHNPGHSDSYINMGVSHKNLKQLNEAAECYKKALEINPQDHVGHYNLALCLIKLKKNEEALESYSNALAHDPTNKKYKEEKAELMARMGREDDPQP
jgi:tetratricopeptide (TPR) repeat protein